MKNKITYLLPLLLAWLIFPGTSAQKHHKVILMAGQSNMEGPGRTDYLKENNLTRLLAERDDVWCVYAGRVTGPLLPEYGFRRDNFGPELLFGHK
ncbi:MAG: hypothetical protein IH594_12735, partial [Bacteroidales bacterium]|nr:hypothetical protein [Bacteroidales bacterium]